MIGRRQRSSNVLGRPLVQRCILTRVSTLHRGTVVLYHLTSGTNYHDHHYHHHQHNHHHNLKSITILIITITMTTIIIIIITIIGATCQLAHTKVQIAY
jgi:hypothetical protein